jgi:D-cysteine desulfhydrase family pyridoxal phosphate-dependent enzyme
LQRFPRQHRSLLPTPAHRLEFLCRPDGPRVWCKRDDLTGFGFGGNKTRKLDFLIAEALAHGCDTLIAIGANQSNFCRVAAAYGTTSGMQVHLVLGGKKPRTPTGNLRLDHLLGVTCHHVNSHDWDDWAETAARLDARLRQQGRRVYRLPVGGSTPTGALGYVEAMAEIIEDERRLGIAFDALVMSSSSAGTQAGLVVGQAMSGWRGRIIGMTVAKPAPQQVQDVHRLAVETGRLLDVTVSKRKVMVDESQLGTGYALRTPQCVAAVRRFAREGGIFLDYVYTGKAAAGLIDALDRRRFRKTENILFLHTGGSLELFE